MQMVFFVLDDPEKLDDVLDAWHEAGISGATIVDSTGMHRRRARTLGARYAIGFPRFIERAEQDHCTLFVIVDGQAEALRCLAAAESVIGDLDRASTGVFAAWDLTLTKGVARWGAGESEDKQ